MLSQSRPHPPGGCVNTCRRVGPHRVKRHLLLGRRPPGRWPPARALRPCALRRCILQAPSHTQVTTTPRPGTPRPGFSWGHRTSTCTIHMFVGGCSIYIFCVRVKKPRGPRPAGPVPPDEDGHTRQHRGARTWPRPCRGRTPLAGPRSLPGQASGGQVSPQPGSPHPSVPRRGGAKLLDRGAARVRRMSTAHAARRAPAWARRMRRAGAGEGGPRPRPPPRPAPARRAEKSTARAQPATQHYPDTNSAQIHKSSSWVHFF